MDATNMDTVIKASKTYTLEGLKIELEKKPETINVKELNLKAKEFVPKKKLNDGKLTFNTDAKAYIPKAEREEREQKEKEQREKEKAFLKKKFRKNFL